MLIDSSDDHIVAGTLLQVLDLEVKVAANSTRLLGSDPDELALSLFLMITTDLNLPSREIDMILEDRRVVVSRRVPLNDNEVTFYMDATNCVHLLWFVLEGRKSSFFKLFLKIFSPPKFFNLLLLDLLSFISIGSLFLLCHLEVLIRELI